MPLLDIATPQPSFRNQLGTSRTQLPLHGNISGKFSLGKEKRLSSAWKVSIQIPEKMHFNAERLEIRGAILIKAVATLESKYLVQNEDGHIDALNLQLGPDSNPQASLSSGEDSTETDGRERLRRMRISKANKGNVPWNKGRKHSAETLQRIRERTKLAMQDPKVKMKLVNLGHTQSKETRIKIGVSVRMGWQRRHKMLMVQETCCFEWKNLIAEASRRGYTGEEELQWDSYKILDEQLEEEWLESIEQRKSMPRLKGSRRAPKSPEQRRKISEAISAKWTDPGYRERVFSALSKYHGTPVGAERKPRRKPSGDAQSVRRSPVKKASEAYTVSENGIKSQGWSRKKRSSAALYKDPLADSKLAMIKNIREQRAAMETKKTEAMERAKLLIAEAEKAAKALEVAAAKSPLAQASLLETRKLIAEATRSIEAVETGQTTCHGNKYGSHSPFESNGRGNHYVATDTGNGGLIPPDKNEVNGTHIPLLSNNKSTDFNFSKHTLQNLLNSGERVETSFTGHASPQLESNSAIDLPDPKDPVEPNGAIKYQRTQQPNGDKTGLPCSTNTTTKRKWVNGRLVEVAEGD